MTLSAAPHGPQKSRPRWAEIGTVAAAIVGTVLAGATFYMEYLHDPADPGPSVTATERDEPPTGTGPGPTDGPSDAAPDTHARSGAGAAPDPVGPEGTRAMPDGEDAAAPVTASPATDADTGPDPAQMRVRRLKMRSGTTVTFCETLRFGLQVGTRGSAPADFVFLSQPGLADRQLFSQTPVQLSESCGLTLIRTGDEGRFFAEFEERHAR